MDPPAPPRAQDTPSTGFQNALSVLKSTHAPSGASNRNASGGLPPIPKPSEAIQPEAGPSSAPPAKPVNRPAASKNAIIHSVLQRRNPVLKEIRNVGLEIGDISVDYQVGAHNGVLFLSLKYHRLHPEYIHTRIEKMRHAYHLRVLLILCDINEHQQPLRELSKIAVVNEMTMLVAFSNEEAAQYLTTLKAYEHKSADTLKEKVHQSYRSQLEHVLTSGRKVNKSNAEAVAAQFGSFADIARQSNHTLSAVKGLGKVKIVSLLDSFNKPFVAGGLKRSEDIIGLPPAVTTGKGGQSHADEAVLATGDGEVRAGGEVSEMDDDPEALPRPISDVNIVTGTPTGGTGTDARRPPADVSGDRGAAADDVFHDPLDSSSDSEDDGPASKRLRV